MAENILTDFIAQNEDILLYDKGDASILDQSKILERLPNKIQQNIDSIKASSAKIVDSIAQGVFQSSNEIDTDETPGAIISEQQKNENSLLENLLEIDNQLKADNAATRIGYVLNQKIEETILNSSAKDNYNFKKDPGLLSAKHDFSSIYISEIDRSAEAIIAIANVEFNKAANEQTVKKLLG